jgi:hypothetical protein
MVLTWVWLVLTWIGGIAAILGGLMSIASFLLWLTPDQAWQNRLKVTGFALGLAIVGFLLLRLTSFPTFQ